MGSQLQNTHDGVGTLGKPPTQALKLGKYVQLSLVAVVVFYGVYSELGINEGSTITEPCL